MKRAPRHSSKGCVFVSMNEGGHAPGGLVVRRPDNSSDKNSRQPKSSITPRKSLRHTATSQRCTTMRCCGWRGMHAVNTLLINSRGLEGFSAPQITRDGGHQVDVTIPGRQVSEERSHAHQCHCRRPCRGRHSCVFYLNTTVMIRPLL